MVSLGRRMVGVSAVAWLVAAPLSAQSNDPAAAPVDGAWSPPRTAWGVPDLQGIWDYRTMTPLQRPREFSDQAIFT